jgi:hypothetical protein
MLIILQTISIIIAIMSGAFTLSVAFSKPLRKKLFESKSAKEREEAQINLLKETGKGLLRNAIVSFYYTHNFNCVIKQYEYENIAKLYAQYKGLGGNSFIDKIWEEIKERWIVVE